MTFKLRVTAETVFFKFRFFTGNFAFSVEKYYFILFYDISITGWFFATYLAKFFILFGFWKRLIRLSSYIAQTYLVNNKIKTNLWRILQHSWLTLFLKIASDETDFPYVMNMDAMDPAFYDQIFNFLEDRGITEKFVEEMSTTSTDVENNLYRETLEALKSFIK